MINEFYNKFLSVHLDQNTCKSTWFLAFFFSTLCVIEHSIFHLNCKFLWLFVGLETDPYLKPDLNSFSHPMFSIGSCSLNLRNTKGNSNFYKVTSICISLENQSFIKKVRTIMGLWFFNTLLRLLFYAFDILDLCEKYQKLINMGMFSNYISIQA